MAIGRIGTIPWLLGGYVFVALTAVNQTGSFGWMAGLQMRLFGRESMLPSIVPASILWLGPLIAADTLYRLTGFAIFAGIAQATGQLSMSQPARAFAISIAGSGCGETGA